jgi:hypothetical protein
MPKPSTSAFTRFWEFLPALLLPKSGSLACSGLSRVRTEFFQLLVIPSLAPRPVHPNGTPVPHLDWWVGWAAS